MTVEIFITILKTFGLPVALLLVMGWAYWRKDRENKELNEEVRATAVEMAGAVAGHKEVSAGIKEVLGAIDHRLDNMEAQIAECKTAVTECKTTVQTLGRRTWWRDLLVSWTPSRTRHRLVTWLSPKGGLPQRR